MTAKATTKDLAEIEIDVPDNIIAQSGRPTEDYYRAHLQALLAIGGELRYLCDSLDSLREKLDST